MSERATVIWPPLDSAYTDEFGDIDQDVYQAAGSLWPEAERFAVRTLGDPAAGHYLLHKASAAVTRARSRRNLQIDHLESYLFQTYKRLVLDHLHKERSHRQLAASQLDGPSGNGSVDEDLERMLLVQEVIERMDGWTLNILRLLLMDYSYKEIGGLTGLNPHTARIRFRRRCQRIVNQLEEELKATG